MTVSGGYGNQPNDAGGRPNGHADGGLPERNPLPARDERDLDDAAALVLDALTDEERSVAMQRVRRDPAYRREVAELGRVVGLLPSILRLPDSDRLPSTAGPVGNDLGPSADLRARILAQVAAEAGPPSAERAAATRPATRPAARPATPGPARAARSDTAAARAAQATLPPSRPSGRPAVGPPAGRAGLATRLGGNPWLLGAMAALILLLAVATIALAIRTATLSDRVDSRQEQITQLDQESAALRNEVALANSQSNASAWVLNYNPTAENPTAASADGTVFYSYREQSVVAEIRNLAQPAEGQAYQLWYLGVEGSEQPRSAGVMTFVNGIAFFTAANVQRDFDAFAVSVEPATGSEQPTTTPILIGSLSAAG